MLLIASEHGNRASLQLVSGRCGTRCSGAIRKVVRRIQCRVDDSFPFATSALLDDELQRLPVGIDHHVDIVIVLRLTMNTVSETPRLMGPVNLPPDAVPLDIIAPEHRATQRWMVFSKANHLLKETKHIRVPFEPPRSSSVSYASFCNLKQDLVR
jgi:hypothetical protein